MSPEYDTAIGQSKRSQLPEFRFNGCWFYWSARVLIIAATIWYGVPAILVAWTFWSSVLGF